MDLGRSVRKLLQGPNEIMIVTVEGAGRDGGRLRDL